MIAALASMVALAAAAPREYTVELQDQAPYFSPRRLKVERGSKVTWKNRGPGLAHTVYFTSESGVARSGPIHPKSEWSFTFSGDAVVRTSCEIHPYMYGIVIVGDPPASLIASVESPLKAPAGSGQVAHIIEYPIPVPNSVPGILAIDRHDNVWMTLGGGGWANIAHPPLSSFGRLTADGDFTVYQTPTRASGPSGIILDRGGNVLITELMGGKIARFDPVRRAFEEFPIPTPTAWPTGLALDRAGTLWFNQTKGNKVGRLSPDGAMVEFPVPTPGAHPTGMDIDSRGNVWIAERDASKIGCLRPDGVFVEYDIPTPRAKPAGVAVDRQDRVWFAQREGNKIGVIENGRIREYPLPTPHAGPFFIAIDHNGLIWFSEVFANQIGALDPRTGRVVEFRVPTPDSWPGGLAFDSQGGLWFTEQLGNKVANIPNPTQAHRAALERETSQQQEAVKHHPH
jgi:virginiamycin B lyase